MKTISANRFLSTIANGINCCIYHFNEDKILSKTISIHLVDMHIIYSLNKAKRKNLLCNPHPIITKNNIIDGKANKINEIYIPLSRQTTKEGLLWLFFSQKEKEVFHDSFLEMILTLSQIFNLLTNMKNIKETNSLYIQSALFMSNLISNSVLLYDHKDQLLFHNSAAEKMNMVHVDAKKLKNNKVLDIYTNEFHLGNKLIGKIKYTSNQDPKSNPIEHQMHKIRSCNKIIGKSPQVNRVLSFISQVASTDSTVLLSGESGTGKEQYAKLIHNLSQRRNEPFVALNCAAIPENLLESELFGYEGGSFTGAKKEGKVGKFEMANTGTLFLDEIGDMPLSVQVKLLRVLQERYIEPVGSNNTIPIDVRIICATHQNLEDKISVGEFREDLFFRINVIPIDIPSLNNKHNDIELLLTYYVKKYCLLQKKSFMTFSYDAMEILKNYHWQGNIRELINVVEYCVTMSNKSVIDVSTLPAYIQFHKPKKVEDSYKVHPKKSGKPTKKELKDLVDQFGNTTEGKKQLANHLNISLATLYRWISKCK